MATTLASNGRVFQSSREMSVGAAIFYLLFSFGALLASLDLVLSEYTLLKHPNELLGCDMNPIVGCGNIMKLPVSHLFFGTPNAVWGLISFSMLFAVAFLLLLGMCLPKIMWGLLMAGTLGAVAYVFFFQYQSLFVLQELCPLCFVVWLCTIALFVLTWGHGLEAIGTSAKKRATATTYKGAADSAAVADLDSETESASKAAKIGTFIRHNAAVIIILWYALLIITLLVHWWDRWLALL